MSRSMKRRWRTDVPREAVTSPEAALRAAARSDPRAEALCTQVRRTLESVIPGELQDPALEDLTVVDVIPAPSMRRLRVVLRIESMMQRSIFV